MIERLILCCHSVYVAQGNGKVGHDNIPVGPIFPLSISAEHSPRDNQTLASLENRRLKVYDDDDHHGFVLPFITISFVSFKQWVQ